MTPDYTTRTTCRVCGSEDLSPLFSLGDQYVSDFVLRPDVDAGPRCPIDVDVCRSCTLVQARHTARQDFLYTRHYWYRSGTTETMRNALRDVVDQAVQRVKLEQGDVVLDIGANDGTLLSYYPAGFVTRVAVEPAKNLAEECRKNCDVLIPEFWESSRYEAVVGTYKHSQTERKGGIMFFRTPTPPRAKIITALGMFYDIEDPNQFITDVAKVLHPDGVFVAQLMCLKQTLEKRDVGNFAHEHLEFYTLESLRQLFERHGLDIEKVEENSVNGGSYRVYVRHAGKPKEKFDFAQSYRLLRAHKGEVEVLPKLMAGFLEGLGSTKATVRAYVQSAVDSGKKVWVYGASTKGNVMLQYWGLNYTLIEAAADKSPEKWDKYTVGTGIPIRSEGEFRAARPDYALVLPYSFVDEFVGREQEWRDRGGKFIVPLPEFRIV